MISDAITNDFVKQLTTSSVWIGAHRVGPKLGENGQWTWIDGSPVVYSKWFPNQPDNNVADEFCLEMNFGGVHGDWNDAPCDTSIIDHFLCQI